MVLILGGKYQGKLRFALENIIDADKLISGEIISFDEISKVAAIDKMHLLIIRMINEGLSDNEIMGEVLKFRGELIICDEVGGGIISVDKTTRRYVELVGRICCELALKSDEVYRIYSGIAHKLKG